MKVLLVQSAAGFAVYLGGYRIAGAKPTEDNRVIGKWEAVMKEVLADRVRYLFQNARLGRRARGINIRRGMRTPDVMP